MSVSRARLSQTELGDAEGRVGPSYRWRDATVQLNNAEIEERIKNDGDKWDRGVFEPAARAKYMNQALKRGMADATDTLILGEVPLPARLAWSVGSFALVSQWYKWGWDLNAIEEGMAAAYGVLQVVNEGQHIHNKVKYADLPAYRRSLFPGGTHYDRHIAALGLSVQSKLIRANS